MTIHNIIENIILNEDTPSNMISPSINVSSNIVPTTEMDVDTSLDNFVNPTPISPPKLTTNDSMH
ncbi:17196_t:CDS:1, partial [Funneliformis geosporum]